MRGFTVSDFVANRAAGFLAVLFLLNLVSVVSAAVPVTGTNEDFSDVSKAVVELLQSRDTARFAAEMSPTFEDWQSVASTNEPGRNHNPLTDAVIQHKDLENEAKQLLAKADSLHVDFSKGRLRAQVVPPIHTQMFQLDGRETRPWLERLELVLIYDLATPSPGHGDFKVAMHCLIKFPRGWRFLSVAGEGVQWVSFPSNIADAKTIRDTELLDKVKGYEGITEQDDPALRKLANAMVHFIRNQDMDIFKDGVYATSDLMWTAFQPRGHNRPSRKEFENEFKAGAKEQMDMARSTIQQMEDAGIDLRDADIQIKECAVGKLAPGSSDSVVGLSGQDFTLTLAVKTERKSKNGTSLSGNYYLTANQIMRFAEDWKVTGNIHWHWLPKGILDAKAAEKMDVETSITESGILPEGIEAPEIEFTTLDAGKKMKLSDFRGKVVLLLFWDTLCPGCQIELADLQSARKTHPNWREKVAILPLSIDSTLKTVRARVTERGWTNTFNVWAGAGDFHSKPAEAFRLSGLPTAYIIDGQGQIIKANPSGADFGKEVDAACLTLAGSENKLVR